MLLSRILSSSARLLPAAPALTCANLSFSYAELATRVARLAGAFAESGVGAGDRVAIWGRPCHHWVEAELAAVMLGAIAYGIYPRLSLPEVEAILADGAPSLLVYDGGYADAQAKLACPTLRQRVCMDAGADHPSIDDLIATHSPYPACPEGAEDDVALIIYTGGSTGTPRGAMHTHRGMTATIWSCPQAGFGVMPLGNYLTSGSFAHISGQGALWRTLFLGWNLVIPSSGHLSAAEVVTIAERYAINRLTLVGATFRDVLNILTTEHRSLPLLRYIGHGGAPATVADIRQAIDVFPEAAVVEAYALTESGLAVTCLDATGVVRRRENPERLASVGRPDAHYEVRIVDEQGVDVPRGEVGEIICRGDAQMKGYWRNPTATAEVVRDGWLYTGDLGRFDADGFLYIVDRKKDLIIVDGMFNVFSAEVEGVVLRHPAVREGGVIGISTPDGNEEVTAVVVTSPGSSVTLEEIRAFCAGQLADYKIPTRLECVDQLPRTPAGKIHKARLRELFSAGRRSVS